MRHQMGLYNEPFQSINSGKKVFEVRLYDKKRQQIKQGDEIVFTNLVTEEIIAVKVTEIRRYESFKKMYEHIDKKLFDREELSIEEMLENTYEIYTKEQEKEWGTVAIGVEVIK
ncbi:MULTISPECIES: ASCH domain-containing protein [Bacillus]|uniref:ASCH domain-containing protein n=2 Tax=Bacillus cereus group TaxID=86661 RepID=A0A2C1D1G4_BACCE|nr:MULTISPECIES: ASCH domain-containing protein [Bacillus cereus group]OFD75397.1 ASCH domain-containing protein [Bacillus mycoides]OFD75614.1 ASCH domain-containing protein [Bacillus mycoides]OFD77503.1 ASCH domain-containing protein [Bacillus mycoides]PGS93867.1 ASCH domain-containing protein [Bacillus cereus]